MLLDAAIKRIWIILKVKTMAIEKLKWRTDADAETVLGIVGVEYQIIDVQLSEIDWVESANNCARLGEPLNEKKIEDYGSSMRRGDVFPMVVLEKNATGAYTILGGNQRCNALKRLGGEFEFNAYVVHGIQTTQRECIIRSLNSRHGWGSDKEERILQAVYLVASTGITVADAARLMTVCEGSISSRIRAEECRRDLARKKIDSSRMNITTLDVLCRAKDDGHRYELAKLVSEYSPSADSVVSVIKSIDKAKGDAAKVKVIREFSTSLQNTRPSVAKKNGNVASMRLPRREKLFSLLEKLADFLDRGCDGSGFSCMDELQCTEAKDGDRIRVLHAKINARLDLIGRFK